ncbi:unnamed protein product [Symbiodinium natans]|uniref:Uncharacterized protein n=1 Tax=Symbiodinium natans TaxID=878477 RepID=A0A812N0H5_9DINO|nr:unnamed protein product [Symbiodinium natans]
MLEHVLSSCVTAGGFGACPKIVVSDGFRVASAGQRPKPKAGRIPPDWEEPYEVFRHILSVDFWCTRPGHPKSTPSMRTSLPTSGLCGMLAHRSSAGPNAFHPGAAARSAVRSSLRWPRYPQGDAGLLQPEVCGPTDQGKPGTDRALPPCQQLAPAAAGLGGSRCLLQAAATLPLVRFRAHLSPGSLQGLCVPQRPRMEWWVPGRFLRPGDAAGIAHGSQNPVAHGFKSSASGRPILEP